MSSASAPAPPAGGAIRFNRLQLGVVVVGVLLMCAFAGSSAYDAWRSYRYSVAAIEQSGVGYAFASDLDADESTKMVMAALPQ